MAGLLGGDIDDGTARQILVQQVEAQEPLVEILKLKVLGASVLFDLPLPQGFSPQVVAPAVFDELLFADVVLANHVRAKLITQLQLLTARFEQRLRLESGDGIETNLGHGTYCLARRADPSG